MLAGLRLVKKLRYDSALTDYTEAARLDPTLAEAHIGAAWILAGCPDDRLRNGAAAVMHATKACELTDLKNGDYLDTLAAACAEAGDFPSAVQWEEKAIGMALSDTEKDSRAGRLALYQTGKPYRYEPKK